MTSRASREHADQTTQLDLGRDSRAHDAAALEVGPVLHLEDAAGAKTTALLGRALPRDFIGVAAALDRYWRRQLLELAFTRDQGLRAADATLAAGQLDRLDGAQCRPHRLTGHDVRALRERFASWPHDAAIDDEAHAAHNAARRQTPSAADRAAAGFPTSVADALQPQPAPPHALPPASPGQQPPDEQSRRRS